MLTIIIPVFNRDAQLRRAIDSVLIQQCDMPVEIIIVDDGSQPLISPHPLPASTNKTLVVVRHEHNQGAAQARNTGLDHAHGDLISFLDSDDVMRPGTLARRLERAKEWGVTSTHKTSRIVACGWYDVTEQGAPIRSRIPRATRAPDDFLAGCWFSPGSCVIANRALFEADAARFDPALKRLEDFDLFARLALKHPLELVIDPTLAVDIEVGGKRDAAAVFDAAAKIESHIATHQPAAAPTAQAALAAYLNYERAKYYLQEGKMLRGIRALATSWFNKPRLKAYPGPGWEIARL